MRKIALVNQKGGTGKTTTVINLGAGLTQRGYKTLLIDLDPQGNVGIWLGLMPPKTLYHILVEGVAPSDCVLSARENLDVIASNNTLVEAELMLVGEPLRERVLAKSLASLDGYDYILLDCAPSLSLLNQNAIVFADEVFVPISMEYLAVVGVKQVVENLKMVNKLLEHEIGITLIIPTFYDVRNKKSREILESLKNHFPGKVVNPIRINVSLSEAPSFKETIFEYAARSHGAHDYNKLTDEVIKHEKKGFGK